ncbi:hypothetical protein GCM10020000_31270 [Streptomyces olivoverticillatus]
MSHGSRKSILVALATAAVAATLAAPARASTPPRPPAPSLAWKPCVGASDRECADLTVPLDYRKPGGRHLTLAVSRLRSNNAQARRGTLLLIPGGPGGSGRDELAEQGQAVRDATHGAYDIVSFDPRGAGGSTRAQCGLNDDDRELTHLLEWPSADGHIDDNVSRSRRTAEACLRNGGDVLRSFSTANEVRDIDRLRQALGEEKLSAWGVSYGTYVGAVYAQKYPEHTDRWVLDSSGDPDPARVERGWMANMAGGADDRFPDFAAWAADPARDAGHRLAERAEDVRPMVLGLAAKLDRTPGKFAGGQPLNGNHLRQALQHALYGDRSFAGLAELIAAVRDGKEAPGSPVILPDSDAAITMGGCSATTWSGRGRSRPTRGPWPPTGWRIRSLPGSRSTSRRVRSGLRLPRSRCGLRMRGRRMC